MSHYILNLLPLKGDDAQAFEAIVPQATHCYARRSNVTDEMLEQATIILGWPRPQDLSRAKNLRWFHSMFAGLDEYSDGKPYPQGCLMSGSAGANAQGVSQHMLASLLALCRRIPQARDAQLQHQWDYLGAPKTILGATVLVLGAGNIGRHFGKLCQSMGAHTIGFQRTPSNGLDGFHAVETMDKLDSLLPTADVVALCLPRTPETDHIMNRQRFSLMKSDGILLNAGRGNAIDQDALVDALQSGHLWAAALDVTDPEPLPTDHPLWTAPNLLLTPHCAGGVDIEFTRTNVIALALENLRRYMAEEPLLNQVVL